jgi:hypothetical protein
MLPLGFWCIKMAKRILSIPRGILMPLILLFCIVGSYATNNSVADVGIMLVFGLLAYVMEENGFPVAPAVLGVVLGGMLEEHFVTSMIKSGRPVPGLLRASHRRHAGRGHAAAVVAAAGACWCAGSRWPWPEDTQFLSMIQARKGASMAARTFLR